MANLTTVTQEQIEACTRHIDEQGKVFYTVQSATDPDGFYTVRWNAQYKVPQDNCKAGREGRPCWHKNATIAAEVEYQNEVRINRDADLATEMESRSAEEISEQAQVESYIRQGVDRATAERVTYAKPATSEGKGHLGYFANTGFSLLK